MYILYKSVKSILFELKLILKKQSFEVSIEYFITKLPQLQNQSVNTNY